MSKNINRAKLNKAQNSKEYLAIQYSILYPIYWDECTMYYPKYNRGTSKDNMKFFRKQKLSFQIRMYKTWKHNRKTQWRE